ncbi:amino acid permease [Anaerocolumna cellulosilytica]|uniref:Amino acid permease n=1 Tax=Anaerocolumna cellulosilytica TaxID=433286 RepID=A0A6S6R9X5_9FIRM|nr:amino acid permease [Anaerocolumna cellulosilytica]MBB5195393.1 L-asparagine transporter-like permease [Anaerocolumna cellulosilytica]BCJ95925.1 amino acid permease [Anaerocolumna cellulosilytica]
MNKEKGLSAWQLTMMALGTVIGGSFFLGSSVAIHSAGPSIIIAYILGGVLVYFILYALSEMTVANPSAGSFRSFANEAYGQGAGFVVGWVYWTGMVLAMSSEATAVSILVREWLPRISITWLGSFIIIGVTLLNLLGASKLSKLESGLAAIKVITILAFIVLAALLVFGILPGRTVVETGETERQAFLAGGVKGIAGSMLIVMFSYAGFEIIGLAASEAKNPGVTVPKAINYTVLSLLGLYILSVGFIIPMIPTEEIREDISPMVAALNRFRIGWAGTVINVVLITAILSTMLAAMFGLGRMIRSLADDKLAPGFIKDKTEVPYRGIIFSGLAMLAGLGLGLVFPRVYLFLISSGGFALLFTYAIIMATHIKFRKKYGCPEGKCRLRGFPYSSLFALIFLVLAIISMPFIKGQGSGLAAGAFMIVFYSVCYGVIWFINRRRQKNMAYPFQNGLQGKLSTELSEELTKQERIVKGLNDTISNSKESNINQEK